MAASALSIRDLLGVFVELPRDANQEIGVPGYEETPIGRFIPRNRRDGAEVAYPGARAARMVANCVADKVALRHNARKVIG